ISWWGAYRILRRQPITKPLALSLLAMTFSGWVATVAGWYVTEIGRQPWLVNGVLLTKDAVANIPPAHVGITLTAYLVVYAVLLMAYIGTLFYIARKAVHTDAKDIQRRTGVATPI